LIARIVVLLSCFSQVTFAHDFNQLFDDCGVKGSITVFSYGQKKWFFSDEADAEHGTLPASTFKIVNSLIALDEKVIKDATEIIAWDREVKAFKGTPIERWNRDTNLKKRLQKLYRVVLRGAR